MLVKDDVNTILHTEVPEKDKDGLSAAHGNFEVPAHRQETADPQKDRVLCLKGKEEKLQMITTTKVYMVVRTKMRRTSREISHQGDEIMQKEK